MLDCDLAIFYGYEVKALNQQVKRNIERFPEDFRFKTTKEDIRMIREQISYQEKQGITTRSQFVTLYDVNTKTFTKEKGSKCNTIYRKRIWKPRLFDKSGSR